MNYSWNFLGNSKVPRGPKILLSAPFSLCAYFVINRGLKYSWSKHAFDMQEIVAPVSNNDTIWLLLTLTGKLAEYLLSMNLASIIACF